MKELDTLNIESNRIQRVDALDEGTQECFVVGDNTSALTYTNNATSKFKANCKLVTLSKESLKKYHDFGFLPSRTLTLVALVDIAEGDELFRNYGFKSIQGSTVKRTVSTTNEEGLPDSDAETDVEPSPQSSPKKSTNPQKHPPKSPATKRKPKQSPNPKSPAKKHKSNPSSTESTPEASRSRSRSRTAEAQGAQRRIYEEIKEEDVFMIDGDEVKEDGDSDDGEEEYVYEEEDEDDEDAEDDESDESPKKKARGKASAAKTAKDSKDSTASPAAKSKKKTTKKKTKK